MNKANRERKVGIYEINPELVARFVDGYKLGKGLFLTDLDKIFTIIP